MQKTVYFFIILYLVQLVSWIPHAEAKEKYTDKNIVEMQEVTVTATRIDKEPFNTPNAISIVNLKQLEQTNADIVPNLLQDVVGVWGQQTTVGQGSPLLRGLTGYQTLMQVDWVRLNNSTFRSGPNQYLATLSPETLDRAEVLRGSSSTLYGSGAMGGVINLFTKSIPLNPSQQVWNITPRLLGRYTTATQERLGRLDLMGNRGKFGFTVGSSVRYYGDLNPGKGYDLHYQNRKFEIVDEAPRDTKIYDEIPSSPPERWLIEKEGPLGWHAFDADAKIAYQLTDGQTINLAYQMWRQPQTPRYDKIAPREFDEFYFEPQNRDLLYLNYIFKPEIKSIDLLRVTTSFHRQKEGRNEVKRDATTRRQRFDTVNTIGLSTQVVSGILPRQRLVCGGEFYIDLLQSRTVNTDLETGKETVNEDLGRFINDSQFWDVSVFLQDEITIHNRVEVILGGRATVYQTTADLSIRDNVFDDYIQFDSSLTGSAGIVIGLTNSLNLVSSIGTAFRAPSLNDTTGVEVTNEGITAPSPDLDPETSWTIEGGLKAKYPFFRGALTIFHSRVKGLVARIPVEQVYEGDTLPQLHQNLINEYEGIDVLLFANVDEVQYRGVELAGIIPIHTVWSFFGNAALLRGEVVSLNGQPPDPTKPWEARVRREPPLNGVLGIQWEPVNSQFWGTLFVRGAAEQRRLNRSDIRDPRIQGKTRNPEDVEFDLNGSAIDAGTPGWLTVNIRGGVKLFNHSRFTVTFENLIDKRYRPHGSGVNAPGFNVSLSLDNRF